MRDLAQIDKEIAEVQARIARRNEGMPLKSEPAYRAARFDYIVEGDRSGLDSYQNALNAAIQNKLSRDSQERLLKEGKEQADDEAMDQWQKDYSFAKSAKEEIDNDPKSTQKQKDDAAATVRYYEAVGAKKGYMKKYSDMTKAPETPKVETPAATPAQPAGESFKQLIAKGQTLETDEDLDKYIGEVKGYTGNDAVVGEAYDAITAAMGKKKANADKRWATLKNEVDAAIKDKDKKKLEELQGQLDIYDGQTDLPTVRQKVSDALKTKPASPVVQYIKNLKAKDLMGSYTTLRKAKNKTKTDNAPIGAKSYPYKIAYNNDGSLTVSGGGYSRTFKSSDFGEESLGNEKKPKSTNSVANVLSGGGDKKENRGSASRKARVAEPED